MSILSGRNGSVLYDPAGATPVALVSLKSWKASFKTDYDDTTCFGDPNKTKVPGLPDVGGSGDGFWNSSNVVLFGAASATAPGKLKLVPSTVEPTFFCSGLAYLSADIAVDVKGAPNVSFAWVAAGAFVWAP
ncbi:MAG TPA: hypothetical protein VGP77_13060 [Vicinamibacterales bacterium]|jgi:hypothetical protein|nr:hypothetical protein [Vicinamibacterales bacterium]